MALPKLKFTRKLGERCEIGTGAKKQINCLHRVTGRHLRADGRARQKLLGVTRRTVA